MMLPKQDDVFSAKKLVCHTSGETSIFTASKTVKQTTEQFLYFLREVTQMSRYIIKNGYRIYTAKYMYMYM